MVRVAAPLREREPRGPERFGHASNRPEISRILHVIEVKPGASRLTWKSFDSAPRQARDGEQPLGRVGVREARQEVGVDFEDFLREVEGAPLGRGKELGGGKYWIERQAERDGLAHEMRPFEQGQVAFTSLEAPNILDRSILPALDSSADLHAERS